jgi:Toastrack DUF4097
MALSIAPLVLALIGTIPAADTTLTVREGERLLLENFSGQVLVGTWERDEVWIEVEGADRLDFDVRSGGGEHRVRPADRKGRERSLGYRVRVPTWLALEVQGSELDVRVEDHEGGIDVRTMEGDITLIGVSGEVRARTLDGELVVDGAEGDLELFSLDDDVSVSRVSGTVRVEANDGSIYLEEMDARVVEAHTVDGDVSFSGVLRPGGKYDLGTHDGDIRFSPFGEPDARVSVSTFDGEFETELLVQMRSVSGGEFEFVLGNGSAEVRLEAFDGSIRLERSPSRNRR